MNGEKLTELMAELDRLSSGRGGAPEVLSDEEIFTIWDEQPSSGPIKIKCFARAIFSRALNTSEDMIGQLRQAEETIGQLQKLSVTNIMLDVTPGWDGMGHEVYAKSVDDVVNVLTKMGTRLEDVEGELATLRAVNQKRNDVIAQTEESAKWPLEWCFKSIPETKC